MKQTKLFFKLAFTLLLASVFIFNTVAKPATSLSTSNYSGKEQKKKPDKTISFTSFNIEYNREYVHKNVVDNFWKDRLPAVIGLLNTKQWQLIGTQELTYQQLQEVFVDLPGYTWTGVPITGELKNARRLANFILYQENLFEVLDEGVFWFTDTPEVPNEKGWDAYSVRNCNWVKLKVLATGKELYYFNLHLDHKGKLARTNSVQLLLQKVQDIAKKTPAIISGDFNLNQNDNNYTTLSQSGIVKDARDLAKVKTNETMGTFNGYRPAPKNDYRIDHIFLYQWKKFKVESYEIVTDKYEGVQPSDHYPVAITFQLK